MILETDFPDHWKTQALISTCGDKAVMCLIRLWIHCQLRKTWKFPVHSSRKIEAICRWNGESELFVKALIEVGFLDCDNDTIIVHDFEKFNSKLCRNWENGQKGGRPKNTDKDKETQPKPKFKNGYDWDNPNETHDKPNKNPNPKMVTNGITQTKSDSKDSKDSKEDNITPIIPLKGDCVETFSAKLKASGILNDIDIQILTDEFATFAQYRKEVYKKPIKAQTGARHAQKVIKRIENDNLKPEQIVQMFEKAMDSDWEGWDFDSEVQRVKSLANGNEKNKTTPHDTIFTSIGSFGVPAGAMEGGVL